MSLDENRGIAVRLRLLPTLDTQGDGGLRIGVSLDNGAIRELVLDLEPTSGGANTPGRRRWYDAVIANGSTLTAEFGPVSPGEHTLKVWRIDDNIVIEAIDIVPL